jgi:hypothetical protein
VLSERQLHRALTEFVTYVNGARPDQGLDQCTPIEVGIPIRHRLRAPGRAVVAVPILGGLHHEYQYAA